MKPEILNSRTTATTHRRLGGVPEALGESDDKDNNNNKPTSYSCSNNNNNKNVPTRDSNINNNNTTQKTGTRSRLPGIKERRQSVTIAKPSASAKTEASPDMSTTRRRGSLTAEGPVLLTQRRASVPQGGGSLQSVRRGSKLTFLGAGRRMTMLLRSRQAFQSRKKPALPEEEEEDHNPMAHIHKLPQSPRFSTLMSVEAQYATLKGYEDKLFDELSDSKPEVRSTLQRTKTPFQRKITVVDQDKPLEEEEEEEDRESPEDRSISSVTSSSHSVLPASTRVWPIGLPSANMIKPMDNRNLCPASPAPSTMSMPYLKPLRRQTLTGSDINGNGMVSLESSLGNLHMQRSYSLPTLDPPGGVSMYKRLVLTHRLESAMDLLDSMKQGDSVNSLSPRVIRGQAQPHEDLVKKFNCWTQVWNKEFKEAQA